ncbi:MAG: hypothetical protein AB2747_05275 [Candidatus Thiodiazotropha taylori]
MTEVRGKYKANVVEFPSVDMTVQIQREKIRIINTKERTRTPEDTLKMFSEVARLNIIYLSQEDRPDPAPVIESLVDMAARIDAWLD